MAIPIDLAKVGMATSASLSGATVLIEVVGDIKRISMADLKAYIKS